MSELIHGVQQDQGAGASMPGGWTAGPADARDASLLEKQKATEVLLKLSLQRERALLRRHEELIRLKEILSKESEHRLLNGLQLIAGLLTIQSRTTRNAEAAGILTTAANRVAAIGRVHRDLHTLDNVDSVEFKHYLENLCRDLSAMAPDANGGNAITVAGTELELPTTVGIPLGFIASELITNAIKYAKGKITVELRSTADHRHALSVCDDGPGLPEGFEPSASRGLGMRLISSLVGQIGGQLQMARGDKGTGTRITVLFSS